MYKYAINVELDDNDSYLITCPDFPEVVTFSEVKDGDDGIVHHATNAINEAIASKIDRFEALPMPSKGDRLIAPDMHLVLKALLVKLILEENVNRAELTRRLKVERTEVERLFKTSTTPSINKYQKAFKALNKSLDLSLTNF